MTTYTTDRADSGEIPRIPGEITVRLTGERTENLAPYMAELPPPLRRHDATGEYPALIAAPLGLSAAADLDTPTDAFGMRLGEYDMAAAQPVAPWERVVDTDRLTILGSLGADELATPPASPPPLPEPPRPDVPPRELVPSRFLLVREQPSLWERLTHVPQHRKAHPVRGLVWFTLAVVLVAVGLWVAS